jgi:hypothetical protein
MASFHRFRFGTGMGYGARPPVSGWLPASLYSINTEGHEFRFTEFGSFGLTPDCVAKLSMSDMRAQKADSPTIRMPQVLNFMNANQEFPEIASPDSGRAFE